MTTLSGNSYDRSIMPLARDQCICLRKIDYSETSQILLLLSREHGLLRVIAKGAHRRTKAGASNFDGGLDLLDLGEGVFIYDSAKELSTLTAWSLREGHLDLRRTLRPIYLAQFAAELVGNLIEEHDPHPETFDRLVRCVDDLATPKLEESFLAFELDLLRDTGYLPELESCVSCSRRVMGDPAVYFSPARGGVVCRNCESLIPDRQPIDVRLIRMLQSLLSLPRANGAPARLPRLTRHQTDPINRLMIGHVEYTLGKPLRLRRYVV